MKSNNNFYILCVCLVFTLFSFSQQRRNIDNSINRVESDIFNFTTDVSNFLQLQQVTPIIPTNNDTPNNANNAVFIQQIGNNNIAISNTNSEFSRVVFFQEGNDNLIESSSSIPIVAENVIQQGNNNNVLNFTFGNIPLSNLNVIQQGNNLTFQQFGANALTNSLQFTQTGNARTITIRAFSNPINTTINTN